MERITRELLQDAKHNADQIRLIRKQLSASYNTYHSPRFDGIKPTSGYSDPVTEALHKIDKLSDQLSECCRFMIAFEDDLMQIPDSLLRTIIRSHYLLGYSWAKCSKEILECNNPDSARIRLFRYLRKRGEKDE